MPVPPAVHIFNVTLIAGLANAKTDATDATHNEALILFSHLPEQPPNGDISAPSSNPSTRDTALKHPRFVPFCPPACRCPRMLAKDQHLAIRHVAHRKLEVSLFKRTWSRRQCHERIRIKKGPSPRTALADSLNRSFFFNKPRPSHLRPLPSPAVHGTAFSGTRQNHWRAIPWLLHPSVCRSWR